MTFHLIALGISESTNMNLIHKNFFLTTMFLMKVPLFIINQSFHEQKFYNRNAIFQINSDIHFFLFYIEKL
jgi:hypothetical protein